MFGKNNYQERLRNMTKQTKQDQFSIRKLSIGAMAVLLSFTFLANCHTAKADTVTPNSETNSSANKQTVKADQSKLTTYSGLSSFFKTQDENKPHVQSSLDAESASNNSRNVAAESVKAKNELSQNNKITKDDEAPTTPDTPNHIHNGKWNNIDAAYNDETKELTLTGGTDTEPALMSPNQGGSQLQGLSDFLTTNLGDASFSKDVKRISINGKIKVEGHARDLFSNLVNLTTIEGLTNLDTSDVTDMWHMFAMDASLTSLDLSHFDTTNVTNMNSMFSNCSSLTNLDLSKFNTSKVTDMTSMFSSCENLTNLDLSHFNTAQVTDMDSMFNDCLSLVKLNVSSFNTLKVTNMSSMFRFCLRLTNLNVSNFDTSNVVDMKSMFQFCLKLTSLNVSQFNTSKVTDMRAMFSECSKLTSLDLSHFDTAQVTDMDSMFEDCKNLTSLDLSHFNTSKVTTMDRMFYECPNLQLLSLGKEFKFLQGSKLEELPGKWINWGITNKKLPKGTKQWSSKDFTENYAGNNDFDTYIRFINLAGAITVQYRDQSGQKISNVIDESQYGNVGDSLVDKANPNSILSFKRKEIPNYKFDHAEIDGKKVDLANIKYTEKAQTITLFYTRINSGDGGSAGSAGASNAANSSNPNNSKDSGNQSESKGSSIAENTKNVTLKHNAYLYDSNARHFTGVILSAGSVIASYGIKTVKGQQYYVLKDKGDNNKNYYVSVGNAKPVVHKLKHSARVYNKYGQRVKGAGVLKRGRRINTFGNPVTIRGCQYFVIDKGRFAKVVNFALTSSKKTVATVGVKAGSTKSNVIDKTIMHNAYLYDNKGNRNNGIIILAGSKIGTSGLKKINGKLYYALVDGMYIAADNINYNEKKLKHRAYVYNQYGNHSGKKLLKKGKSVKTYGKAITIKHKKYYTIAKNRFIKKANFR